MGKGWVMRLVLRNAALFFESSSLRTQQRGKGKGALKSGQGMALGQGWAIVLGYSIFSHSRLFQDSSSTLPG